MKVFVGYGYNDRDRWIKEKIIPFIESLGCDVITGEDMHGEKLSEGVSERIEESDLIIGFLTQRDTLTSGKFTTHKWVTDELSYALAKKIPILEVIEENVEAQKGMTGDRQRVDLKDQTTLITAISIFIQKHKHKTQSKFVKFKKVIIIGVILLFISGTVMALYYNETIKTFISLTVKNDENIPILPNPTKDVRKQDVKQKIENDTLPNMVQQKLIESTLTGTVTFFNNANQKFNIDLDPYYENIKDQKITTIQNISNSTFKETRKVIPNEKILFTITNHEDKDDVWVLDNTGTYNDTYFDGINLLFRKKDDYYFNRAQNIEKGIHKRYQEIDELLSIDWISDDISKWYYLNILYQNFLFKKKEMKSLIKRCEEVVEDENFSKLSKDKKDNIFSIWRKGIRKFMEEAFEDYDDDYISIGYVTSKVIKENKEAKKELKRLLDEYNKHFTKRITNSSKDLNDFLNI